jgi:mono/diheme cytochrome c family protein
MRKLYRVSILLVIMLTIAACGTVATPRYEADRIIAEAEEEATRIVAAAQDTSGDAESTVEVAAAPTEVPTEIPATEVPTEAPTEIPATEIPPTEVPTEVPPTVVPTEIEATTEAHDDHGGEAAASGETSELEAEIMAAVEAADATAGESKFLATGCTGCHMTTDMQLVGPGLQGVFDRAGGHADHRPADQGPYEYIFTSIRNSQAFVVEGFAPGLMPVYTEAQLSDEDIYNIMAYLHQFSSEE